jgi:hypothetical protein
MYRKLLQDTYYRRFIGGFRSGSLGRNIVQQERIIDWYRLKILATTRWAWKLIILSPSIMDRRQREEYVV